MALFRGITMRFSKMGKFTTHNIIRNYSKSNLKVTLCGAAGNVGQPLSLILKQSPYIDELALYDIQETTGLAMELSHIDTKCRVSSFAQLASAEAFCGASVVVLALGQPAGSTEQFDRNFDVNALIVKELMTYVADYCPKALVAIASNPIDAFIPLASEVLKQKNAYNPSTVFGVTTLNVIRANTYVGETLGIEPECVMVPVIGGNTDKTIVPILSQARPCSDLTEDEIELVTNNIRHAHECVVKVKSDEGPVLSTAFAIARFVISLIKGVTGQPNIIECAFIKTNALGATRYLALPVLLGPNGVQKDMGLPEMTMYEKCLLEQAVPVLLSYEERAKSFLGMNKQPQPCDPCDPDPKAPICPEDYCEKRAKGLV